MAYTKNLTVSNSNRVSLSGSNVQITGSLFGTVISGTTAQFTRIVGGDSVVVGNGTTTSTSDVLIEARNDRAINTPFIVINDTNTSSSANTVFGRLAFRGDGGTQGDSSTRAEIRTAYADSSGATELRLMTAAANSAISTRMTIGSSGDITIGNGNLIIGTSGKGIDFNVTTPDGTSPSSELLDDYEEGTWTPIFSAGASTFGYGINSGGYTKIGNLVTVTFNITLNSGTFTSNALSITGLPFTSDSIRATGFIQASSLTSAARGSIFGSITAASTSISINIYTTTASTGITTFSATNLTTSSTLFGCITYRV